MLTDKESFSYTRKAFQQNIIIGMVIHTLFAGLDFLMFPEHVAALWESRFLIPLPFVTVAYFLSQHTDYFSRRQSLLVAVVILSVAASVIDMMALLAEQQQFYGYYVGLMLCLIFNFTIKGYNFTVAAITGVLIVAMYELSALFWFDVPYPELVISTFMLVGATLMGMAAMRTLVGFEERILDISYHDPLTGIANRRAYDDYLQSVLKGLNDRRHCKPMSLLLLDIDFFKTINDHGGHPLGDACLVQLSRSLSQSFGRHTDMVARIGGDEFAVILPATDEDGARSLGERAMEAIRALKMQCDGMDSQGITVSMGLVTLHPGESCEQELVYGMADRALMLAKSQGRDCLTIYERGPDEGLGSTV